MKRYALALAAVSAAIIPSAAGAQVLTPTYMAPRGESEMGVVIASGPVDLSVEWIWRRAFSGFDVGLRGGVADVGDAAVLIGGEFRSPLAVAGADPLEFALTGGAQAAIGESDAFGVQGGVSVGASLPADGLLVRPYVHPRLALIDGFGPADLELELQADIGADVRLLNGLIVRIALMLGDESMLGAGVSWR